MGKSKSITCSKCGSLLGRPQRLEANMKLICGSCGHHMKVKSKSAEPAAVVAAPQQSKSSGMSIVAALLLLVAGVGIGYGVTQGFGTSAPENEKEAAQQLNSQTASDNTTSAPTPPATQPVKEKPTDVLGKIPAQSVIPQTPATQPEPANNLPPARLFATDVIQSFDGSKVEVKNSEGSLRTVQIDELPPEDQKFVFVRFAPGERNDLPPAEKLAAAPSNPPPPKETPLPPVADVPPGFPLVRDWVDNNGRILIRGKFGGVKSGNRVIIELIHRDWSPVNPAGNVPPPFRGRLWVLYSESGSEEDIMVRVGEAALPGNRTWTDIPRGAFEGDDHDYLTDIEAMKNYAFVVNNKIIHFAVPLRSLSESDQQFVESKIDGPAPGPPGGPGPGGPPVGLSPGGPPPGSPPGPGTGGPPASGPPPGNTPPPGNALPGNTPAGPPPTP